MISNRWNRTLTKFYRNSHLPPRKSTPIFGKIYGNSRHISTQQDFDISAWVPPDSVPSGECKQDHKIMLPAAKLRHTSLGTVPHLLDIVMRAPVNGLHPWLTIRCLNSLSLRKVYVFRWFPTYTAVNDGKGGGGLNIRLFYGNKRKGGLNLSSVISA